MKPLDVICIYSNPIRWKTRSDLHDKFEDEMIETPGVRLTTVECEFGDRPFLLPDKPGVNRVRVRSNSIVWNKENLINLGIQNVASTYPDFEYVCWADADISFRKSNWAIETVHALQHYKCVQPWSDAYDLGPNDEHLQSHKSFLSQYWNRHPTVSEGKNFWKFANGPYDYPHPGYAWACTREVLEVLGGLLEIAAVGSGDHHMALGLVGQIKKSVPCKVHDAYLRYLLTWEQRAIFHINYNLGYVPGTIEHGWHGKKSDRKYLERWQIILKNDFNPDTDLKKNVHGVVELTGNKPRLRHDLETYFHQRNEDGNTL